MAPLIHLDLNPGPATLRRFGFIATGVFGWLAFAGAGGHFPFRAAAPLGVVWALGIVAALSGLFAAVFPRANRALYVTLALVGFPVGVVVSYVALSILFFGVIAPVGAVLRLMGNDPLRRARRPGASSWVDAGPERSKDSYFRQY